LTTKGRQKVENSITLFIIEDEDILSKFRSGKSMTIRNNAENKFTP
jgi:hypothetical protein